MNWVKRCFFLLFLGLTAKTVAPKNDLSQTTNFDYKSCGNKNISCFGLPNNCIGGANCKLLIRLTTINQKCDNIENKNNNNEKVIHINMTSLFISTNQYIAIEYSNQSCMSGVAIKCSRTPETEQAKIEIEHNLFPQPQYCNMNQSIDFRKHFTNMSATYSPNGQILNCQLQIKIRNEEDFLNNQKLLNYRIVTRYPFNPALGLEKNETVETTTTTTVNHEKNHEKKKPQSAQRKLIVKIHAMLMIFGWIGCVTSAILMSRFARNIWTDKKLFGDKLWFAFHRYLMLVGWLAIVTSYVIIFIQAGGWTKTSPHAVMGIVAGSLATLQVINSFIRPSPDSRYRWIYNYCHWFIGNAAHLLATANIIASGLKRTAAFFWLIIAYIFVYLLFSDLLRKMETLIRNSKSSFNMVKLYQFATLLPVAIIGAISIALMAIMFSS